IRATSFFRTFLRVVDQDLPALLQSTEDQREVLITILLELVYGLQSRCRTRMSRNEYQLAFGGAFLAPFEIVVGLGGFVVFINSEERHVQVVPRIGEIVGVAAEKGYLLFRSEYQTEIGKFLVAVKPILATLVQSDYVRAKAGLFGS